MWAVGRLSLLSRRPGLVKAEPVAAPVSAPANVNEPMSGVNESASENVHVIEPARVSVNESVNVQASAPETTPSPLGLIQRIMEKAKSIFRSIFG